MRVLYVEDKKSLAKAVAQILKKNNYCVDLCFDGEEGLYQALTGGYDYIILDIMLPKLDGISVLQEIRKEGISTPVILLTAKAQLADKVKGLDSGADDYLPKPFLAEELLARLRALGRRQGHVAQNNLLHFADIALNPNTLDLYGSEGNYHLTPKESQLLELLMINRNTTVTTNLIVQKLWGFDSEAGENHVRVHLSFLRKKLALLNSDVWIKTIHGLGYMLVETKEG